MVSVSVQKSGPTRFSQITQDLNKMKKIPDTAL